MRKYIAQGDVETIGTKRQGKKFTTEGIRKNLMLCYCSTRQSKKAKKRNCFVDTFIIPGAKLLFSSNAFVVEVILGN